MEPPERFFSEAWDPMADFLRHRDPNAFLERREGIAPHVSGYTWSATCGHVLATRPFMYDAEQRPTNMIYDLGSRFTYPPSEASD